MTATFDRLGVSFQYPENWLLDEREVIQGDADLGQDGLTATVYSPGGGFWTVVRRGGHEDPAVLTSAVVDTMRQEYDELDVEEASGTVAGHHLRGYDLNFYCLDLTNTTQVRAAHTSRDTLLIICQAEDREFAKIHSVFEAMTLSLLQGLTPAGN